MNTFSRKSTARFVELIGFDPTEAAGLRHLTTINGSGLVGVYDAVDAGIESYGWATVCSSRHPRLARARPPPRMRPAGLVRAVPRRRTGGRPMSALTVRKVTVELMADDECMLMDDKGDITVHPNPQAVVVALKRRDEQALKRRGVSTVTVIDWVNVPAGFVPPELAR